MATVRIDVPAARSAAARIRSLSSTLATQAEGVKDAAERARADVAVLSGSGFWELMLEAKADEMSDRVDYAVLVNGGDEAALSGEPVEYEIAEDTRSGITAALGGELADFFRDLPDDYDRDELERIDAYAAMLAKHQDDPAVAAAFAEALGPEGVLEVPQQLARYYDGYQRDLPYSADDPMWSDDLHVLDKIRQSQDAVMSAFSGAIATASSSYQLSDDFARELAEKATEGGANGWALSQLLHRGTYDAGFLTDIGGVLDAYERGDEFFATWQERVGHDSGYYRLGEGTADQYYDPFVGLFEAMGRTPEAAQDFLYPPGGESRSEYYVRDRRWSHDEFNALGEMLDAASTVFRDPDDPRAETSARAASDAVNLLGARDGDPKIGDDGKDSLGRILASYITDVDRLALTGEGAWNGYADEPWQEGMPPGASFDSEALDAVLGEVMTDESAVVELGRATAALNATRLDHVTAALAADPGNEDLRRAVRLIAANNAELIGFIDGAAGRGSEDAAARIEAQRELYVSLAGDIVGQVPVPGGKMAEFVVGQALSHGQEALNGAVTGQQQAAVDENFGNQQRTSQQLQTAIVAALLDQGMPARTEDYNGTSYPWFRNGVFLPHVANSPEHAAAFADYARGTATEYGDLGLDVADSYDQGLQGGYGAR